MRKNRKSNKIDCSKCFVNFLCLPRGLETPDIEALNACIETVLTVKKGEEVYFTGDPMQNILSVYLGSCKSYLIDEKGHERIDNFYLPGDLIGLESIPNRKHLFSLKTLEDSMLCVIPLVSLFKLMQAHPNLLARVINIASYKMQNDKHIAITTKASQRVADFILNFAYRLGEREQDSIHMLLPMSQVEVSNYLGMAHETVNRVLNLLQKAKVIKLHNKQIQILDIEHLKLFGSEYFFKGQSA
jgi:CRP/FNR family transcriptional regulator